MGAFISGEKKRRNEAPPGSAMDNDTDANHRHSGCRDRVCSCLSTRYSHLYSTVRIVLSVLIPGRRAVVEPQLTIDTSTEKSRKPHTPPSDDIVS